METGRCSVRLTRRYDAPRAEVWTALTEPESQARWLGSTQAIAGVRESQYMTRWTEALARFRP